MVAAERRWWATVLTSVVLVMLVGATCVGLFVVPASDDTSGADLAFVIGPAWNDRVELAEQMYTRGEVDAILISVPTGSRAPEACAEVYVECRAPSPSTTEGEAAMLDDYAAAHEVREAVVITWTPHVERTRYTFEKCSAVPVAVIETPTQLDYFAWVAQFAYQSAAWMKTALTPCGTFDF